MKLHNLFIYENLTIKEVMIVISSGGQGFALSVEQENHNFIRIISDGDIRRALIRGVGLSSCIDVIQKTQSIVVSANTPISEIWQKFTEEVRVIPVLDQYNQVIDVHTFDKRSHISVAKPILNHRELELVTECIAGGWISSGGNFVKEFERAVASHTGVKHAISCSSGTAALHLILMSYGIGPGDEVIVPTLSFIATANAVSYTGAKPVFVDSEKNTWNIDPEKIVQAITPKTKAIIPVHLYGHPAEMDSINQIAAKYDLKVIEDAAEAQGALYKKRRVGALADAATFSFFGNKIVTTGEGGMIVTNDSIIAEKCKIFRDHGMSIEKRYWHKVLGYNYRLTNLQAAIGVAQMEKIDYISNQKKIIAAEYSKHLKEVDGITLPPDEDWADNVFWLFTILIDEEITGFNVEMLTSFLSENQIESRVVFYPIHTQPIYDTKQKLPIAEEVSRKGISLPSAPDISLKEIKLICDVINRICVKFYNKVSYEKS